MGEHATKRDAIKQIWKFTPHDVAASKQLSQRCNISPIVARLLMQRGVKSPDAVESFLRPKLSELRSPSELPGIDAAVACIMPKVTAGEPITIYGDYDADGITATSILYLCLKQLGANVNYHLPSRMEDGYGLHVDAIEKLAARGRQLIISVDCGIAGVDAARRAKELGITLIVTDHHTPGAVLPDAEVIVHPGLPGSTYPFSGLCAQV
ncbi:MAG: DHH family phosphoesterase [Pirellulales bacterium]